MEQVIFLHAHEDSEEALRQIRGSLSQRLVLVIPTQMDRMRLSLLLRLARRSIVIEAKQLCVVSEDRLAQVLAIRMGFSAAASLDEYHGLAPRPGPSFRRRRSRPRTLQPRPMPDTAEAPAPSGLLWPIVPLPDASEQRPVSSGERPGANLEKMLVDGYLPNPAATPDLEEEAERAEREEHERLFYEIDDEQPPSSAQQEADQREAEIIARILQSGSLGAPAPEPPAAPLPDWQEAERDAPTEAPGGGLPRLPTIDEMLREHGQEEIFDWFEQQAARAAGIAGSASAAVPAESAGGALSKAKPTVEAAIPASAENAERLPALIASASASRRPRTWERLRRPGGKTWRRIGVISTLALSLLMLGTGFALIPYADVAYHEEISPYNETLLLDARPAGVDTRAGTQSAALARAEVARFDEVLTAQVAATGRRTDPNAPGRLITFPTQDDVDQTASQLEAQMQQWGEHALRAQARAGDILGPIVADTQAQAFPAVGTSLPDGVSRFQVSVALHLRAALIRHEALLQAAQEQIRRAVRQAKPGFAPQPDQTPKLHVLSVEPAGPGERQMELLVQVQAQEMIGPDISPEQVRQAIAGKDIAEATDYLARQPGISDVSISVQPKWLNRLPIFSARIRIDLES